MEKSLQRFKTGLYGTFYVLSKEPRTIAAVGKTAQTKPARTNSSNRLHLAIHSISLLQMLSFCSSPALQWSVTPSLEWLRGITLSVSLQNVLPPTLQLLAFYASVTWSAMFIGLFLWTMRCFILSSFPVLWPMKLLRAVSDVTVAHLYIPILTSLLHVFTCTTEEASKLIWVGAGGECNTGGHLAAAVVAGTFATLMTLLCALFSLVYYENELISGDVQARAHGRAEFLFLVSKSILIVFAQSFPQVLGTWAVLCLLLAAAFLWLLSIVYWLPFHFHLANQVHAAMAGIFATCCVMCVFAQLLPDHDSGITFLISAPLAAASATLLVNIRAKYAFLTPVQSLPWSVDVELHARYMLHSLMYGHYTDRAYRVHRLRRASSAAERDTDNKNASLSTDGEAKALLAKTFRKEELLQIEMVYNEGLQRFSHDAMLHIHAANFLSTFRGNAHLAIKHIVAAERVAPPFDVGFQIYQTRRSLQDAAGSNVQMSTMGRVSFEKYVTDAKASMKALAAAQLRLWTELLEELPDIHRMHAASRAVYAAEEAAEKAFSQLLALNPQSLLVIRLYAEHCLRLMNDKEKADLLFADAERIDEANKKERSKTASAHLQMMAQVEMDIMADDTGLMHVSAASSNLGTITQVSPFVCRLLGYSRWQLERRNVSCIIPGVIGKAHDNFMRHYAATGEGSVVDYTRSLFAQHRGGYLVPILLCVRETTNEDGTPEFVSIMRALHTAEEHILLTDNFTIIGATLRSLAALDIEASTVTSHDLSFLDWVPEFSGLLDEMKGGAFVTLCLDCSNARNAGGSLYSLSSNPLELSEEEKADKTWVKARLQEVTFSGGMVSYVLAWTPMSSDGATVMRAEAKRRATLERINETIQVPPDEVDRAVKMPFRAPSTKLSLPHMIAADLEQDAPTTKAGCPFLINLPNQPLSDSPEQRVHWNPHEAKYIKQHTADSLISNKHNTYQDMSNNITSSNPLSPTVILSADNDSVTDEPEQSLAKRYIDNIPRRLSATKETTEQRSVASSSTRRLGNLRKHLQRKAGILILPIRLLRTTGIVVTIISIILAIGIIILSATIYSSYSADIAAVIDAGKLLIAALRMGQVAREFSTAYAGYAVLDSNYKLFLIQKLTHYTDEYERLLQQLQELARTVGISEVYDSSSMYMQRFSWDDSLTRIVKQDMFSSLREACLDVLAAARALLWMDPASLGPSIPASELLLATSLRDSHFHSALNDSALAWYHHSEQSADVVRTVWLVAYALMCSLVVITCVAIFLPVISQLNKSRDVVLRQLLQLPEALLRELRKTAERNVQVFADEEDGDDESQDDLSDQEADEDESPQPQSSMEYSNKLVHQRSSRLRKESVESPTKDGMPNSLSIRIPDSQGPFRSKNTSHRSSTGHDNRRPSMKSAASKHIAHTGGRLAVLSIRLLAPILMLLAFYSVLFGVAEVTLNKTRALSASMLVATRRGVLSMDVASLLRHNLRATGDEDAAYEYNRTMTAILDLEYTDRMLSFGVVPTVSETMLASGSVNGDNSLLTTKQNADVAQILFRDICNVIARTEKDQLAIELFSSHTPNRIPMQHSSNVSWSALVDEYNAIQDCRSTLHGSMAHGLHAAMLEYASWSTLYARRRAAATVNATGYGTRSSDVAGQPGAVPYSLKDEFSAPLVQELRNAGFYYLPAADFAIANIYLRACKDAIAQFIYFESLFAASFLVLFVAAMYLYFLRLLQQENRQIRKQGTLMLLLPLSAFHQHKQLKSFLQELMNMNT